LKTEQVIRLSLYTLWAIFTIAAAILLVGLAGIVVYSWSPPAFFYYAFGVVITDPIAIFYLWIRNVLGLRSGIRTRTFAADKQINEYMKRLISSGSTLDIVSGRLHWVSEDKSVKHRIIERAGKAEINIYLPEENEIARELRANGLSIHIIPSLGKSQHARFTLVDKNRPGSALLAVGSGRIPNFTISEFHEASYPQVIELARDYLSRLVQGETSD
jgi:hypothetical protein